jgi:hypothetical protein
MQIFLIHGIHRQAIILVDESGCTDMCIFIRTALVRKIL